MICDFKIRKVKDTRRKIWELRENSIRNDFSSYISKKYGNALKMLVIVLVRSVNYGKSGNRETQVRGSIYDLVQNSFVKIKNLSKNGQKQKTLMFSAKNSVL